MLPPFVAEGFAEEEVGGIWRVKRGGMGGIVEGMLFVAQQMDTRGEVQGG